MIPRSDPATILRAIAEHRVTYFFGLPVTFQSLLDSPRDGVGDLSSLRMCLAGGDSVPIELQRRFQERLGVAIIEACGMTELIPYSANPIHGLNKAGSIGLPAPGVSVRLVDERGCDVPPGEVGEIVLQSEAMMLGYWQDPEATAAVVRDGWLSTGDMARCDEDGYYWFVGRKKEIIIRGGSNVSPPEVENALYQHPAVREAGVVGAPDAVWGEVVHAFVALHEGTALAEAELKQCVAQQLAAYKVPETIHFLPELPKGPTGKVHRKTLREWAAGGLTPIRG
jgi:long-chain acyl-CoA synthetase